MERELGEVIRNRVRAQVMDALYRENTFDVPRSMIDEQVQRLQVDAARRIGAKDASQVPPREVFEDQARRRAALGLLMGQIVQAQGIKVDREKVQTRLNDLVAQYPNPDEARRAYIQNADAMRQVESVGPRGSSRGLDRGPRAGNGQTYDLQGPDRLRSERCTGQ